jgi:hypothetical protein
VLSYWSEQRSVPYWLTIDRVFEPGTPLEGGGVSIAAGGRAIVNMTVPGAGDFEAKELLALVDGVSASDILIDIKEGVGRSIMSQPLPLGDFVAQPNTAVAGLQGGEYRAASGGNCRQFSQSFKRNTRLRIELENTGGAPADIFLAWKGCAHYYDECPPGRGLEHIRSLEPSVGPQLIQAPRCPPVHTFQPQSPQAMPPRTVPPTGFVMPQGPVAPQGGDPLLNQGVYSGSGHMTSIRQFMQTQPGAYAKKTYTEENLRAHGYLNGGGQIQFPDGGSR